MEAPVPAHNSTSSVRGHFSYHRTAPPKSLKIDIFKMFLPSKIVDLSSYVSVESLLQQAQKDDVAFLALIILTGIFYNLYIKEKPDHYHHVWFEKPQQTDASSKRAETRDIGLKLEESVSLTVSCFYSLN